MTTFTGTEKLFRLNTRKLLSFQERVIQSVVSLTGTKPAIGQAGGKRGAAGDRSERASEWAVSEPSTRRQCDVKGFAETRGFHPHRADDRRGDHRHLGGHRHPQFPAVSDEVSPVGSQDEPSGDQDF